MKTKQLSDVFEIRQMDDASFMEKAMPLEKVIFDDERPIFRVLQVYSDSEKQKNERLKSNMGVPFRLNLGVFKNNEFIGWAWGYQESSETYYMCNSAILPEYRRKGLYAIIPKLKAGFTISHMEVSDRFGTLVNLTYLANKTRRKVMEFCAGFIKPDDEIKSLLRI